jgi:hypothetical protein
MDVISNLAEILSPSEICRMKNQFAAFLLLAAFFSLKSRAQAPENANLKLLCDLTYPFSGNVAFGGISGIDYAGNDTYYLISDGSGTNKKPMAFELKFSFNGAGFTGMEVPKPIDLLAANGRPLVFKKGEGPETIRYDSASRSFFWTTEEKEPKLYRSTVEGKMQGKPRLLKNYTSKNNSGIEGLAWADNEHTALWLINERPLTAKEKKLRLSRVELSNAKPDEYFYPVDSDPKKGDNGVSEILFNPAYNYMLVMERRFFEKDTLNQVDLYKVNMAVSGKTLKKVPFFNLSEAFITGTKACQDPRSHNFEAMCWGPEVEVMVDGKPVKKQTLILVTDDNFGANQYTRFVVFTLETF